MPEIVYVVSEVIVSEVPVESFNDDEIIDDVGIIMDGGFGAPLTGGGFVPGGGAGFGGGGFAGGGGGGFAGGGGGGFLGGGAGGLGGLAALGAIGGVIAVATSDDSEVNTPVVVSPVLP